MKILVCGLPGSGKTTFADELNKYLKFTRINADEVRTLCNDWDFSLEGRIRQANRLKDLANSNSNSITDFIAPTEEIRNIFNADFSIWMNTTLISNYADTNSLFEKPKSANLIIGDFNYSVGDVISKLRSINN